jgi:hypothetical protein
MILNHSGGVPGRHFLRVDRCGIMWPGRGSRAAHSAADWRDDRHMSVNFCRRGRRVKQAAIVPPRTEPLANRPELSALGCSLPGRFLSFLEETPWSI